MYKDTRLLNHFSAYMYRCPAVQILHWSMLVKYVLPFNTKLSEGTQFLIILWNLCTSKSFVGEYTVYIQQSNAESFHMDHHKNTQDHKLNFSAKNIIV